MPLLRGLLALFLLPGTLVINRIGINVEEDGGILRSIINMIFWGVLIFLIMLPFLVASKPA